MVGQSISHYKIVEKLGEGGMGEVWLAKDTKLEREVALKFLAAHLVSDPEIHRRFEREAKAAAGLSHSNICTVYEIDEVDGKTFIASEYIDGETLEARIERGPLKLGEALSLGRQIANGLKAAHEKGVVHRDIKPGNILVTPAGQVKVLDFGLALLTEGSKLTKLDTTVGTVAYMSPEQAQGAEVSNPKIKAIALGKEGIYHSSYCFNKGIEEARGEVIVIPDADQIVLPDFLSRVWNLHQTYEKLVLYGYRYDEVQEGPLASHDFKELEEKCVLKNPLNYGGCLSVRKEWLLEMNGYEQHDVFRTGFHANGMLMAARFKNMGLAIQWEPSLKLYHPRHPFTLSGSSEYKSQHRVIDWVKSNMLWRAVEGIDSKSNQPPPLGLDEILKEELDRLNTAIFQQWNISSIFEFPENTTQPLVEPVSTEKNSSLLAKISRRFFGGSQ